MRAAPPARSVRIESVPYITRNIPLTEILSEEGLAIIERNADTLLAGDRHRVPRLPARARSAFATPAATSRASGCAFPRGLARQLCATTPAHYVQHARNPERNVRDRRRRDGVRAQLRLALRPRPRQGPALRHDRGFPEFREARLSQPVSSTIPAARFASRSTCRSTSGISRWSTRISNIPTSRSWAR